MRRRFVIALAAWFAGGGMVLAQYPGFANSPNSDTLTVREVSVALPDSGASLPATGCDSCCPQPSTVCGPPGRFWIGAEYLYWWTREMRIPPLVTAGSPTDTIPGALGQPGTTVLLSGETENHAQSGGRFFAGWWLNECQTTGIEADYLFLGTRRSTFVAGASGTPGSLVIARPFFDIPPTGAAGFQNSQLVAFPGAAAGTISVQNTTRLQGAEVNALCNLCCCGDCRGGYRVDALAGFRWMQLNDCLTITENISPSTPLVTGFPAGSQVTVMDQFCTKNDFYGGQIGVRGEWRRERFFVNARVLVALGDTRQEATINGSTTIAPPGVTPSTSIGGLLAQSTNIGTHSRDVFSVIPEVGINLGYQVTPHLRAYVGYTFLYWGDVVRPGDVIDLGVNPTQLPSGAGAGHLVGPPRPAFIFHDNDFWAQGINVGAEFRF
jgi:hypothetical protein